MLIYRTEEIKCIYRGKTLFSDKVKKMETLKYPFL